MCWSGLVVCLTFCCRGRWLLLWFPFSRCFARSCGAAPKFLHSSRPLVKYPVLGGDRLPQCALPAWGWVAVQAPRGWMGTLCGASWSPLPAQLTSPSTSMASQPRWFTVQEADALARGHVLDCPCSAVAVHCCSAPDRFQSWPSRQADPQRIPLRRRMHTCEGPLQAQSASAAQATFPCSPWRPKRRHSKRAPLPPAPIRTRHTTKAQVPLCSTASAQAQPGSSSLLTRPQVSLCSVTSHRKPPSATRHASTDAAAVDSSDFCDSSRPGRESVAPRVRDFFSLFVFVCACVGPVLVCWRDPCTPSDAG